MTNRNWFVMLPPLFIMSAMLFFFTSVGHADDTKPYIAYQEIEYSDGWVFCMVRDSATKCMTVVECSDKKTPRQPVDFVDLKKKLGLNEKAFIDVNESQCNSFILETGTQDTRYRCSGGYCAAAQTK